jgi:hypothetical protein
LVRVEAAEGAWVEELEAKEEEVYVVLVAGPMTLFDAVEVFRSADSGH